MLAGPSRALRTSGLAYRRSHRRSSCPLRSSADPGLDDLFGVSSSELKGLGLVQSRTRDNGLVPIVPVINENEVDAAVQRAAHALAHTVVRIRYEFRTDWTGEPSIFFRIVLTDEAAKRPRLNDIANSIALVLKREVKPEEHGLHTYFNFRSAAEQAELNEPAWA